MWFFLGVEVLNKLDADRRLVDGLSFVDDCRNETARVDPEPVLGFVVRVVLDELELNSCRKKISDKKTENLFDCGAINEHKFWVRGKSTYAIKLDRSGVQRLFDECMYMFCKFLRVKHSKIHTI